jgi:uncharacterized protein (DUF488 family)
MPQIYALGHSTRSLADIRASPNSRRNPQFGQDALRVALSQAGIRYVHLPRLGGHRRGVGEASPNTAWRNASFRGFVDYMQTAAFARGLAELMELATAVAWRCHRSLVADALLARGIVVQEIEGIHRATPHRLTPFARVVGEQVTYPAAASTTEPGG